MKTTGKLSTALAESDIQHRLIEHRFCDDDTDYETMFSLLRKEEVEAAREIERLNTLLASRSTNLNAGMPQGSG